MSDLILYNNGEIELKLSVSNETLWLTQKQISELFEKDVRTINDHIKAIYKDKELYEDSTVRKSRIVQKEGKREVSRDVLHYNLDIVISVGYKVNSKKATNFRQWATNILKNYVLNGYSINGDKITHQRFKELEEDVTTLKQKVTTIDSLIISNQLEVKQGIFNNGQIFDAYVFINNLLKTATQEIVLIDNYIDDTVLTLFSKYKDLKFIIITKSISKQLKLDIDRYKEQYKNLEVKISNKYHDRFLLIDNKEAFHVGASLKDLGKKIFAFNSIDIKLIMDLIDE